MRNRKGFTLIELLVVVAIIGVLAALVIVNLNTAQRRSRDTRRKADLAQIRTALEMYYDEYLSYPAEGGEPDYDALGTMANPLAITADTNPGDDIREALADQMAVVPDDPRAGANFPTGSECDDEIIATADLTQHHYYYGSDGNDYVVWACLEAPRDGEDDAYSVTNSN